MLEDHIHGRYSSPSPTPCSALIHKSHYQEEMDPILCQEELDLLYDDFFGKLYAVGSQIGMQCNDEHRRKGHRAVPAGVCPISPEIVEVANTSNCIQMGEQSRLPQSPTATSTAPPP